MEVVQRELHAVVEAAQCSQYILELAELQLSLVGGGCGEVVLA